MASSTLAEPAEDQPGGMRERIRRFDWDSTPLGPMESWPAELRFALSLIEHSDHPMAIYWGADYRLIYNDAWSVIPGERHPAALGRPGAEVWPDIWPIIGPQFDTVRAAGKGFSAYGQPLPMTRNGVEEESYWNYSFAPILAAGEVGGILNHGMEVTRAVTVERRLSFQVALSDRLRGSSDAEEIKMIASELLGRHLRASRVGYGEIDPLQTRVTVQRDWTSSPDVMSLAGESRILDAFGPDAIATLKRGEILIVVDYRLDPRTNDPRHASTWEGIATRSLLVVPLVKKGVMKALLYVHEPEPRAWKKSDAAIARDVAERTWEAVERASSEASLRESEDHYRHAVELNPQVSWTAAPDGQLNRVSRRWFEWTGTTGLGESWAEGLHPDDRERTFAAWGNSVATGEIYDIEHRVKQRDGSYRWARSRAFPRRAEGGTILLWYGTTEDIHERRQAEEHQRLLINELNHRVKNTLATVQAIAFQTLKGDIPLAEARARFEARLLALSRAHNFLTERNWEGASLDKVVANATEYLSAEQGRFRAFGPHVMLAPRAALALALAFHELSTNAAKYGALSVDGGHVDIDWKVEEDRLFLDWKEHDGPATTEPTRRGFGSRLIERGLEADLGGTAQMLFEPDGLRCTIVAALDAVQAQEAELG